MVLVMFIVSPMCVCVFRDDEEDGEKAAARQNNASMLSFFSRSKPTSDSHTRETHRFFTERRLQSIDML